MKVYFVKKATVHARTLQRACDALGGVQPLARRLNIAEHELAPWLDGSEQPPAEIFLTALEVVLEHSKARGTTWGASRQTRGDA
jgi:hypothetical protein